MNNYLNEVTKLKEALERADAILIGAGAGLSTSAGLTYNGKRFEEYFSDFAGKYNFTDMYTGGFYPYDTLEEYWAYWSRYIYINRYMGTPFPVYSKLYEQVKDKDYFVLTTNVDHKFQEAGFDKHRLFYTQGDYGLFQCSEPCHFKTYDNEKIIKEMVQAQGFEIKESGKLVLPERTIPKRKIPRELVPYCPICGKPMTMNLRADDSFVEDAGWKTASDRYADFMRRHQNMKVLFLELGVGYNTPIIIKYPFWRKTYDWKESTYACINAQDAFAPDEIKKRSICINGDIKDVLNAL